MLVPLRDDAVSAAHNPVPGFSCSLLLILRSGGGDSFGGKTVQIGCFKDGWMSEKNRIKYSVSDPQHESEKRLPAEVRTKREKFAASLIIARVQRPPLKVPVDATFLLICFRGVGISLPTLPARP